MSSPPFLPLVLGSFTHGGSNCALSPRGLPGWLEASEDEDAAHQEEQEGPPPTSKEEGIVHHCFHPEPVGERIDFIQSHDGVLDSIGAHIDQNHVVEGARIVQPCPGTAGHQEKLPVVFLPRVTV